MLILTGPPGAGKSTVARLLAADQPRSVCLEADWFWTTITSGFVEPWDPASDAQNRTVLHAVLAAASAMDRGGYRVVVDGIVGPWMFDVVREELERASVEADYLVLRPPLDTCLARAAARAAEAPRTVGHPPLSDSAPVRHMWQQFADLGEHEHHVLPGPAGGEPAEDDPARTAGRVRRALASGAYRL